MVSEVICIVSAGPLELILELIEDTRRIHEIFWL